MKKIAPYGSWPSEITTDLMTAATVGLAETRLFNGDIYWLEMRPQEQGRTAIVRLEAGKQHPHELTTKDYSCRTTVHEYGGASYLPTDAGVFFINHKDQQVYCIDKAFGIRQLTNVPNCRFADLVFNQKYSVLVGIAEEHLSDAAEPQNRLVSIDINNGMVLTLHNGQDFYAAASFSTDGDSICFLSWMHPNMPWDGTCLWSAAFSADRLNDAEIVAGGGDESVFQPEWSPDGDLYFVSDRSDWWNLYRLNGTAVEAVCPMQAEFGLPLWQFGMTRYGFIDDNIVLTAFNQSGVVKLACIDLVSGSLTVLDREHSEYSALRTEAGKYCYIAQSQSNFPAVFVGTPDSETLVFKSSDISLSGGHVSTAEPVSFETADNQTAHGFFYRPTHAEFQSPEEELPPLLVMIHGGPTSSTSDSLSLKIQYWTNRGFAVLDVNYRGSTGFGRNYRDALKTQWGIADVQDCEFGVRFLVEQGFVDSERVAIRGGSAGGFTVLAALANTDSFKAGTSLYGVADLTALASDTHKFESRYLDSLIGPYPQEKSLYESRSPISHAESITVPVLFLQGLEDKVVPPSQAEVMMDKLRQNSVPVAYLAFEGEAHGFRKAATISRAFEAELWFYGSVFNFNPFEEIEPLEFS